MTMQLDPHIETFLLLMNSQWGDDEKAEIVKELDNLGIDGQDFCSRHFSVLEKYFAAFERHKVDSPGVKLLQDMDETLLTLYLGVFLEHPDWFSSIDSLPDEEVSAEVDAMMRDIVEEVATVGGDGLGEGLLGEDEGEGFGKGQRESLGKGLGEGLLGDSEIIAALESLGFSSDTKWQIMVLRQYPKKQLEMVAQAVLENLPAFEMARSKVERELAVLLANIDMAMRDPNKSRHLQIPHSISPGARFVPTLALPVVIMVFDDVVIYGLLSDKAIKGSAEFSKEELLIGAKALCEKSKLEILMALKEASLYGMEIAEKVGLTPATVSHHMNALLLSGFVELEKRDGKAYYQLSPKGIERFLTGTGELLL